MTKGQILDYGRRQPHWRRWFGRGLGILFIASLVFLGGLAWQRFRPYLLQKQCLQFSRSPDEVIYEEDPAAINRLLKRDGYVPLHVERDQNPTVSNPKVLSVVAQAPAVLEKFLAASGFRLPSPRGRTVAFMGGLTTPGGKVRLVIVEFFAPEYSAARVYVIRPALLFGSPPQSVQTLAGMYPPFSGFLSPDWALDSIVLSLRPAKATMFAGQRDRLDGSHFTIRFIAWGRENFIDGRISNDENVTLATRHN